MAVKDREPAISIIIWRNRDQSDTKGQARELARYFGECIDMAREVLRVKLNQFRGLYDQV